jgi:ribosome recycling factor
MEQAVSTARTKLAALDPERARPELLEGVRVPAYGGELELRGLASVGVQPPQRLVVTPFDSGLLGAVERAIRLAHPDLSPTVDGPCLRVTLPLPSAERRAQLARSARAVAEEARVAIRVARQDALNDLRRRERDGTISAAQRGGRGKDVQRLTDEYVAEVEAALATALTRLAPSS